MPEPTARLRRKPSFVAPYRELSRSGQMPNKVDYGVVDLNSPFLLDPVATSLQNDRSTQLGNEFRHIGYAFADTGKVQDDIAFAGHVQRWYGDLCPGKRSEQLPVAIDVAVP